MITYQRSNKGHSNNLKVFKKLQMKVVSRTSRKAPTSKKGQAETRASRARTNSAEKPKEKLARQVKLIGGFATCTSNVPS